MFKRFASLLSVALVGLVYSSVGWAQIAGTDHDFSSDTWNVSGEICIVCHTPHNADTTVSDAPLWDHALQAATTTYTVYDSTTLDATITNPPGGISKLCLSCHDGTVAIDSFGANTGSTFISGGAQIGTDLADDHPISFTYDTTLSTSDGELHDPSVATTSLGGTIDNDLLFGGNLECGSCHDVHDDTNGQFLIMSNAGSDLCLTCHDK